MNRGALDSPLYFLLLGLLCGTVGTRIGWRSGNRWILPAVQGLLGALGFGAAWQARGVAAAALTVGGWAAGATLAGLFAFRRDPARVDRQVLRAAAYRGEMLDWLRGGTGLARRPLATILAHVRELSIYLVAALLTANVASIVMGAVLLNSMNAWVVRLLAAARRPWEVRLLAWNAWSLVRVAAYVLLGAACAAPVAVRFLAPARVTELRWLAAAGAAGIVLDLVLKLTLSRWAGRRLAAAVDLDRLL